MNLCVFSDFQKEEVDLIHSKRDVKSAVGRLNGIFMILYFIIAVLVIAICLVGGYNSLFILFSRG